MRKNGLLIILAVITALAVTGCGMSPKGPADTKKTEAAASPVGLDLSERKCGSTYLPEDPVAAETAEPKYGTSGGETGDDPGADAEKSTAIPTVGAWPAETPTPSAAPVQEGGHSAAETTPAAVLPTPQNATKNPVHVPSETTVSPTEKAPVRTAVPTGAPTQSQTEQPVGGSDDGLWDWITGGSGMKRINKPHSPYDGIYVLSDDVASDPDGRFKWGILTDPDVTEDGYICTVYASSFRKETRDQMEQIIRRAYPTAWAEVMDIIVRSIRQELWESVRKDSSYARFSGTFGTRYLDGREVRILFSRNCSALYVFIFEKGHINPEKPVIFTEEQADALSAEGVGRSDSEFAKWFREVNGL